MLSWDQINTGICENSALVASISQSEAQFLPPNMFVVAWELSNVYEIADAGLLCHRTESITCEKSAFVASILQSGASFSPRNLFVGACTLWNGLTYNKTVAFASHLSVVQVDPDPDG